MRVLLRSGVLPERNLASLLFRLEHNRGIEDVSEIMQTIMLCAKGEEHAELRRAFAGWIRHVLLPRALPQIRFPPAQDFTEIKDMQTETPGPGLTNGKPKGCAKDTMRAAKKAVPACCASC